MDDILRIYMDFWAELMYFDRRVGRKKFWITALVVAVITTLLGIICHYLWFIGDIIFGLYLTLSAIPALSLLWRRMHDTGREGWWGLIPILNLIFALGESEGANRYGSPPRD